MTGLAASIDFILRFKKHMGLELLNEKTYGKKKLFSCYLSLLCFSDFFFLFRCLIHDLTSKLY